MSGKQGIEMCPKEKEEIESCPSEERATRVNELKKEGHYH